MHLHGSRSNPEGGIGRSPIWRIEKVSTGEKERRWKIIKCGTLDKGRLRRTVGKCEQKKRNSL